MKNATLCTLLCSALLAGCLKEDSSAIAPVNRQNQNSPTVNLSNKTTIEILDLKYNRAELKCSLWSQRSTKINLEYYPNDFVILDLKKNMDLPQEFELNSSLATHKIKIAFKITQLSHYENLDHTDLLGNNILAKYSPYVKVQSSYASEMAFGEGQLYSESGSTLRRVSENINDVVLSQTLDTEPVEKNGIIIHRGSFHDHAECILDTDIKPEYQDQFIFTPTKN